MEEKEEEIGERRRKEELEERKRMRKEEEEEEEEKGRKEKRKEKLQPLQIQLLKQKGVKMGGVSLERLNKRAVTMDGLKRIQFFVNGKEKKKNSVSVNFFFTCVEFHECDTIFLKIK